MIVHAFHMTTNADWDDRLTREDIAFCSVECITTEALAPNGIEEMKNMVASEFADMDDALDGNEVWVTREWENNVRFHVLTRLDETLALICERKMILTDGNPAVAI
jgi:hypothetical protein